MMLEIKGKSINSEPENVSSKTVTHEFAEFLDSSYLKNNCLQKNAIDIEIDNYIATTALKLLKVLARHIL